MFTQTVGRRASKWGRTAAAMLVAKTFTGSMWRVSYEFVTFIGFRYRQSWPTEALIQRIHLISHTVL
jgi:hypothetical protein